MTKADAGQWTLGGNNTFSGGLSVTAGTLNLTSTNSFSGGISISGGTLSVGSSATLGSNVAGNAITIKGGNLLLAADTNVGNNQAISITSAGGGIGVSATPGTGFPNVTVAAGAPVVFGLNYTGTGGINSTGGANGTTSIPGVNALFTSSSATFLGSFAAGTGTGTYTGATLPVGANSTYRVGGGGGTIMFQNPVFVGANNLLAGTTGGGVVVLPNADTYTGTTTIQNGTLTAASLNSVAGGTASSSLGAPTNAANGTITIGSGSNTAGLNYTGAGQTTDRILNIVGSGGTSFVQNSGSGALVFSSTPTFAQTGAQTFQLGGTTDTVGGTVGAITDNGTTMTSLAKNGFTNSTWTIGTSTYSGNTTVNGGVLSSPTVLANSSLITLAGANTNNTNIPSNIAILQTNGTFARNISTTTGLNLQTNGGFSALGGKLTVTLNGGAAIAYGTQGFFPNNGTLSFGSTTSDSQVELTNGISLAANDGFQRTIYVEKGVGGDSALLSGVLTNTVPANGGSNPGIVKQGKGTLILSGANTFSGVVTVSGGSLVAGSNSTGTTSGAFGTGTGSTNTPTAPSAIVVGDGNTGAGSNPSVLIGGAFSVDRKINFNENGTNNTFSIGGTTDNNATFSGAISSNVGNTVANGNSFQVTQAATSGTNALNLTGGIAQTAGVTFANLGTVNVSGTGISGTGFVNKTGAGTLNLSAASSYTGATRVNAGTMNLAVAGTNSGTAITGGTLKGATPVSLFGGTLSLNANYAMTPTSTVTFSGGTMNIANGVLQGQGATNTGRTVTGSSIQGVGMLTLAANSTLNYAGASGTAVFSNITASSAFTLNVVGANFSTTANGMDSGTDRLIFANQLTVAQLSEILFTVGGSTVSATEVPLDSTFYEVVPSMAPVPEPSTWAAGILGSTLLATWLRRKRTA